MRVSVWVDCVPLNCVVAGVTVSAPVFVPVALNVPKVAFSVTLLRPLLLTVVEVLLCVVPTRSGSG